VPFYWSDLEPVQGKPRFAKDSPYCYRRPSTDALVEFCEANGITTKGHPLCWHMFIPEWVPQDKPTQAFLLEKRIAEIAARYKDSIRIFDVCNEAVKWNPFDVNRRTPEEHVELAFALAAKYFPKTTTLTYNDYACWDNNGDYTPFYMLGRHLKGQNVNLGAMGLQYHQFTEKAEELLKDDRLDPMHVLRCLDQYAKLGLPMNVSEITITARHELGQDFQKEVAERLYRLWFSHSALNGIIWWNLIDGTAAFAPLGSDDGENRYKGGLLNYDLSPKPAYTALHKLITEEWTTKTEVHYADGSVNKFQGFYGDYEATIKTEAGTVKRALKLSRGSINKFKFTC
jgi:endo-1,4-beta-xylanase